MAKLKEIARVLYIYTFATKKKTSKPNLMNLIRTINISVAVWVSNLEKKRHLYRATLDVFNVATFDWVGQREAGGNTLPFKYLSLKY